MVQPSERPPGDAERRPPQPTDVDRQKLSIALELVSGDFDGELSTDPTSTELQQLAAGRGEFPDQTAAFRRDCDRVRGLIASLPVQPVSTVSDSGFSDALASRRRSPSRRYRFVSIAATAVLALGVMLTVLLVQRFADQSASDVQITDAARLQSEDEMRPMSPRMATEAPAEAGARPDSAEEVDRAADVVAGPGVDPMPLAAADHWNVVVLTVTTSDREQAMKQIGAFIDSRGYKMPELPAVSADSEWVGVVLKSAASSEQRELVNEAVGAGVAKSAEWDPRSIASATREELLAAAYRSMQSPTQSELYHGQVFLAVSKPKLLLAESDANQASGGAVGSAARVRGGGAEGNVPSEPETLADKHEPADRPLPSNADGASSRSMLIVFRFAAADPARPAADDGRI